MSRLRVSSVAVSLDGFGAGPDQDLQNPLGVFRFVTDGIHAALQQARDAAGDRDIRLGGGVSTIRQYLRAGLIDELHLAIRPVLMGAGEALYTGIDLPALGYEAVKHVAGERATHVYLRRRAT